MSNKPHLEFSVELYSSKYRSQTIDILKLLWHDKQPEQRESYFNWKYERNPYCQSPLIILSIYQGKVIGALGHMVQRVLLNGVCEHLCVPVDGIVHPDFRMYGIYLKMLCEGIKQIQALKEQYGFKLFFNASSNYGSAPGLVKLGWRGLLSRQYLTKFSWWNCATQLIRKPITSATGQKCIRQGNDIYDIEISDALNWDGIESLQLTHPKAINFIHEPDYYEWLFSFDRDSYRFAYLKQGQKVLSYLSLRCKSPYMSSIEDYGFIDAAHLRLLVTHTMRRTGICMFRQFFTGYKGNDLLIMKKIGFHNENKLLLKILRKKVRTPVYIKVVEGEGRNEDYIIHGINCLDGDNWQIKHLDVL